MNLPKTGLVATVWLGVLGVGLAQLASYEKTPGRPGAAPTEWPESSGLTRAPGGPTLLMFAHPRCPCTRASLAELGRLVDEHDAVATVVFYRPADDPSDAWEDSALVDAARADQRITLRFDPEGVEADRFGATTSGACVLYDRQGRLAFCGGVTAGRGHQGPSESQRRLAAGLAAELTETVRCPTYGCSLRASDPTE